MKKLLLIGALLVIGTTAMSDIIVVGESDKLVGTGYLPITATGEVVNVTDTIYLRVKPTSNIGPDSSSLLFSFGQLTEGKESTLVGTFDAEIIKNENSTGESNISLTKTNLIAGFDTGIDGGGNIEATDTQTQADIEISSTSGDTAEKVGTIEYNLTHSVEGNTVYKGVVRAKATIVAEPGAYGQFIDKTKRIGIKVNHTAGA